MKIGKGNTVVKLGNRWPVTDIFGPTLQGEGVDQGVVSHFVRFGKGTKVNSTAILKELGNSTFPGTKSWINLTGNASNYDLDGLVTLLQGEGFLVAVEADRWRDWFWKVDRVCFTPNPHTDTQIFLQNGLHAREAANKTYEWLSMKLRIYDHEDLDYAEILRSQLSDALLYLVTSLPDNSLFTLNTTLQEKRNYLLDHTKWLAAEVMRRPKLWSSDVIVQTPYHLLLWGGEPRR